MIFFGKKTFLFRGMRRSHPVEPICFSSRSCEGHYTSQKHHIHFTFSFILGPSCDCVVLCACPRGILHVPPMWAKIPPPPSLQKKSFYFPRKNKNVNTFSGSRYWHLHDCSIDGLRNFMFFFVTNGVCNRDSIDLKKCDGEEKEKNKWKSGGYMMQSF
jgi:hypothetical protein